MIQFYYLYQGKQNEGFAYYFAGVHFEGYIVNLEPGYVVLRPAYGKVENDNHIVWEQLEFPRIKIQPPELVHALGRGIESSGHMITKVI